MQRLLTTIVAATLFAGAATLAHAQTSNTAQTVSVRYTAAELRDPVSFQALQHRIADKVDAFCRANPVGGTVASCRQTLAGQLQVQAETRRLAVLRAANSEAYAAR